MTPLGRFQKWFRAQRQSLFDDVYSTQIYSLGNPGWAMNISLKETPLEDRNFLEISVERSEHNWIFAKVEDGVFKIRCGPENLEEALTFFCDWAEL